MAFATAASARWSLALLARGFRHDGGFWVGRLAGFDEKQTLRSWTLPLTLQ